MKKGFLLLVLLLSYNLTACSSEKAEPPLETAAEKEQITSAAQAFAETKTAAEEETKESEDLFSALGFPILLPENPNWITNVEYYQQKENSLEIYYHDDILGGDCILLADKESISDLSDITYDESAEETWEGDTASGQKIYVKVQHSTDGKIVTAVWEYNHYQFAIQGNVPDDVADTNSIPKTALYVIYNFESE